VVPSVTAAVWIPFPSPALRPVRSKGPASAAGGRASIHTRNASSPPPQGGGKKRRPLLTAIPDRLTASGMTDDPCEARQVTDEICPPSTRRIEPVMNEALSLARNTAAAANSSISP
jgi:hypothetical protein